MNNTSLHIYEMRDNSLCIYIFITLLLHNVTVYIKCSKIQLQWMASVLTTVFHP